MIFTTAYDEYTLKAFKVNSVDYLLKPIDEELLKAALEKYKKLYADKDPFRRDFKQLLYEFRNQYKSRFLIKIGEKYRSVPIREISHFHIRERNVFLSDYNGKDYGVDNSLEQLQGMLDPRKFFRINRECIVNIDAITLMHSYSSSRLQLDFKGERKKTIFLLSAVIRWLNSRSGLISRASGVRRQKSEVERRKASILQKTKSRNYFTATIHWAACPSGVSQVLSLDQDREKSGIACT